MIEALLVLFLLATLAAGAALAAGFDRAVPILWGARPAGVITALNEGAALILRPVVRTEAPDRLTGVLAPASYLALSFIGLSVVPVASGYALVDSPVGVVVWGACEALVVVAVFLHGWSPNSPFPLIGAYRYAAIALPMMLPSMFVLIAAALPAESLSLTAIVRSQETLWNVLRQPLGLPLFLLTGLALTLRGPFDFADGADLAGGTSAEDSGPARALWQGARLAMLTAGYSPGEADQLRRDMTAWQSQNKIEQHRERLTTRMVENGIDPEFAERVFAQIRGFGEYGFPESHAASFALITYVSAYLRCHHPAAFICGLLNAQPMGFYRPSTIVEDARHMGVEVRAIDVQTSEWNCTLEPLSQTSRARGRHAIRMGLRYIQGFGSREQLAFAAAPGPYRNLKEFVTRTKLPAPVLQTVAEAGALTCFGGDRRQTIWQLRGLARQAGDSLDLGEDKHGQRDLFAPLSQAEEIVWDYQRTSHSTRGHPMSLLRRRLRQLGLVTAKTVRKLRNGQAVDYVGMVLCRQRPTTASGVTFYTLEDETGFVNLVVWGNVFQRYEKIGRTLALLGVSGKIQATREGVVHIIVDVLWDPRNQIEQLDAPTCTVRKRMGRR